MIQDDQDTGLDVANKQADEHKPAGKLDEDQAPSSPIATATRALVAYTPSEPPTPPPLVPYTPSDAPTPLELVPYEATLDFIDDLYLINAWLADGEVDPTEVSPGLAAVLDMFFGDEDDSVD